jgi:hypothetical protein
MNEELPDLTQEALPSTHDELGEAALAQTLHLPEERVEDEGLAAHLRDLEASASAALADQANETSEAALGARFNGFQDTLTAELRSQPAGKQQETLLGVTGTLASIMDQAKTAGNSEVEESLRGRIRMLMSSYEYRLHPAQLDPASLLQLTRLTVDTGGSTELPALSAAVYERFHNDLFGDRAPDFVRNPLFTKALLEDKLQEELAVADLPDPNQMMMWGRDVSRAAELHLQAYGFSAQQAGEVIKSWGTLRATEETQKQFLNEKMMRSISRIEAIEREEPGISSRLFRERGVAHFGRYSEDLLLQQFKELPPGVVPDFMILAHDDHNGAFEHTAAEVEAAYSTDIEALRIAEVSEVEELGRMANQLKDQFGQARNLIIGGHGNTESVRFGVQYVDRKPGATSLSMDRVRERLDGLSQILLPNGAVILVSCSTGAEGAIGEAVAAVLERDTQAPAVPANVAKVTRSESGLLVAEFYDNATRTIPAGKFGLAA